MRQSSFYKKVCSVILIVSMMWMPNTAYASPAFQALGLPVVGTMLPATSAFNPVIVRGMEIDTSNPFQMKFVVDSGAASEFNQEAQDQLMHQVKYFMAGLTLHENDVWVNLSPFEQDRIIDDQVSQTELGRDLLAQDYLLKQFSSSLLYPEKELGKDFWDRVYQQAVDRFGTVDIPVDTFHKVWILPDVAEVYEHSRGAIITQSRLKVMLDVDYVAVNRHSEHSEETSRSFSDTQDNSLSTEIMREIVLPEIEREVNEGETFAPLRQMYHALILAKWYKDSVRNPLLEQIYIQKNAVNGIDVSDKTIDEQIYRQYVEAYETGVFNYIKEELDPMADEIIPRKYFSGGVTDLAMVSVKKTRFKPLASVFAGVMVFASVFLSPNAQGDTESNLRQAHILPPLPGSGVTIEMSAQSDMLQTVDGGADVEVSTGEQQNAAVDLLPSLNPDENVAPTIDDISIAITVDELTPEQRVAMGNMENNPPPQAITLVNFEHTFNGQPYELVGDRGNVEVVDANLKHVDISTERVVILDFLAKHPEKIDALYGNLGVDTIPPVAQVVDENNIPRAIAVNEETGLDEVAQPVVIDPNNPSSAPIKPIAPGTPIVEIDEVIAPITVQPTDAPPFVGPPAPPPFVGPPAPEVVGQDIPFVGPPASAQDMQQTIDGLTNAFAKMTPTINAQKEIALQSTRTFLNDYKNAVIKLRNVLTDINRSIVANQNKPAGAGSPPPDGELVDAVSRAQQENESWELRNTVVVAGVAVSAAMLLGLMWFRKRVATIIVDSKQAIKNVNGQIDKLEALREEDKDQSLVEELFIAQLLWNMTDEFISNNVEHIPDRLASKLEDRADELAIIIEQYRQEIDDRERIVLTNKNLSPIYVGVDRVHKDEDEDSITLTDKDMYVRVGVENLRDDTNQQGLDGFTGIPVAVGLEDVGKSLDGELSTSNGQVAKLVEVKQENGNGNVRAIVGEDKSPFIINENVFEEDEDLFVLTNTPDKNRNVDKEGPSEKRVVETDDVIAKLGTRPNLKALPSRAELEEEWAARAEPLDKSNPFLTGLDGEDGDLGPQSIPVVIPRVTREVRERGILPPKRLTPEEKSAQRRAANVDQSEPSVKVYKAEPPLVRDRKDSYPVRVGKGQMAPQVLPKTDNHDPFEWDPNDDAEVIKLPADEGEGGIFKVLPNEQVKDTHLGSTGSDQATATPTGGIDVRDVNVTRIGPGIDIHVSAQLLAIFAQQDIAGLFPVINGFEIVTDVNAYLARLETSSVFAALSV